MNIIISECKKSHAINFYSFNTYLSLFIWPVIMFFEAYFAYKPFNINENKGVGQFISASELPIFLLLGYLSFIFYMSMVQSAFQMSHERTRGTLEVIFLSPVSRLGMLYGRAFGNLVESTWLFLIFTLLGFIYMDIFAGLNWMSLLLSLALLIVSSVVWGGLLNALMLFSRDSGIFFELLLDPLNMFSGVRMPVVLLPLFGQIISLFFPLTFVLKILRGLIIQNLSIISMVDDFIYLSLVLSVYAFITHLIVKKAEKNAMNSGSFNLF